MHRMHAPWSHVRACSPRTPVRPLETILQENLGMLLNGVEEFEDPRKPLNVLPVYSAFTNDLVVEYAFGMKPGLPPVVSLRVFVTYILRATCLEKSPRLPLSMKWVLLPYNLTR